LQRSVLGYPSGVEVIEWTAYQPRGGAVPEAWNKACKVFDFMENSLSIRLRKPEKVWDKDRQKMVRKSLVPFRFNSVQMILAEHIVDRWSRKLGVKVMIPKARQMGISTFWQGFLMALCVLDPGYHAVVVAHDEASVDAIFKKTRTFEKHLPKLWKLDLVNKQSGKITWEHNSSFWVASIKTDDALLKGASISGVHFSEVANFADKGIDPSTPITSAMQGMAEGVEAVVVYESTAKGRDPCFWAKCEEAKDRHSASEYSLVFLPWYLETAYSMTWENYRARLLAVKRADPGETYTPTSDELNLRNRIQRLEVTDYSRWYVYPTTLTDEQLIWRRWCIKNRCENKQHLFSRYYPSTYEEAFASTVTCMFSQDTVNWFSHRSRKAMGLGNITESMGAVLFESNPRGYTRLWEHPVSGEAYTLGADIGGNRKGSDPCAAYVIRNSNLKVVAAFHGHMSFDHYANYLYRMGQYFNWAHVVVENNHNPAVASVLHRESYPDLYYYVNLGQLKGSPNTPGFNTNRRTRPELINYIDKACRDKLLICPDAGFAREMPFFVWNDKEERYRAMGSNHDDRIMAMALAIYPLRDSLGGTVPNTEEGGETDSSAWKVWKKMQLADRSAECEFEHRGVMF